MLEPMSIRPFIQGKLGRWTNSDGQTEWLTANSSNDYYSHWRDDKDSGNRIVINSYLGETQVLDTLDNLVSAGFSMNNPIVNIAGHPRDGNSSESEIPSQKNFNLGKFCRSL